MKKNYILTFLLTFLISGFTFSQDLLITGIIDGPLPSGYPKGIELFAVNDIADLGIYGIENASNGSDASGADYTFPNDAISAGTFIYLAKNGSTDGFKQYLGITPQYESSSVSINGDDTVILYKNGSIEDSIGEIGVDGTGTDWEHLDGWAYRKDGVGPNATFDSSEWTFSGKNALDGCDLADDTGTNAECSSVFPSGTYQAAAVASTDPSDDFEGNGNITWKADANVMNTSFDNPAPGGINTSAKVLEYSDEGGQYSNIQFDLSTDTSVKYDLSTKNVFTLKVYVPTPSEAVTQSKILWLKLQDGSKGGNSWQGQVVKEQAYEYDVWQELTFDFSSIASDTDRSRLIIQFNGENNNEHVKAYIDDLSYGEGDGTVVEPPADPSDDFEGNGNITWKADANVMNTSFDNPAPGGINTSAKVLEYSDEGGQYSNIQFDLSTDTSVKYDLSTKNVFTLKVYVPTPSEAVTQSKILWLKLQDGSKGGNSWQGQVVKEQAYEYDVWQELTFDFSSIASDTDRSRLIIQFNGENNNEHVKAYIDDLSYGEAATASTMDNALLNISMYPNPASSRLTISAQKTINSAAIYNILGKQVMSLEINKDSESIDVSNLATGMYLIKYSIDNAVGTAKFIKQ